jgi:hypothetical protein
MSTLLGDIRNQVLTAASLFPANINDNANGSGIDMIDADDRCFAIQIVGAAGGTSPTLAGRIQESADNTNWSDVPNATFATVTASNNVQVIVFDRTRRYLRYSRTLGGTSPTFFLSTLIGQQRKTV